MNLDGARKGRTVLVTGTSLAPARERRLAELGIRTGQPVQVLGRTAGGGRLLAVGDARVALDRATARSIEVVEHASDTAVGPAADLRRPGRVRRTAGPSRPLPAHAA